VALWIIYVCGHTEAMTRFLPYCLLFVILDRHSAVRCIISTVALKIKEKLDNLILMISGVRIQYLNPLEFEDDMWQNH
jgi:hypothetical protein